MAASTSSSSVVITNDKDKWKMNFNAELLKMKNDSSNNPLFTIERYQETIQLITSAKAKRYSDRNEQEISLLKTYNVINFGSQLKLVKKMKSTENDFTKYYVSLDELFEVIHESHLSIGHRGIRNTMKEIKKKFVNVTGKQVRLYISGCDKCKRKRTKPKNSSKLIV
jgi:hypothetical protein